MINGLNSTPFYNVLNNYSLYNTTDDNLFTNPYTNLQSEISNPVETGPLLTEEQSVFNLTDYESSSVLEMQQSVEEFESSISNLESGLSQVEEALNTGSETEIRESTEELVESYNQTLENLRENNNYNSIQAADELSERAELDADELSEIGIEVDQFGELTIDEENFEAALAENREEVNQILNSETGFLSELAAEINNLEEEPPSTFLDFGSKFTLYSAADSTENTLGNGLIVDLYS